MYLWVGLCDGFAARLHLRLTLSHALTQHSTSTLLPDPERHSFTQKGFLECLCLWALIRLFCLLRQAWIQRPPKLVPEPFWVPLCNRNLPPWFSRRDSLPSDQHIWWAWQGWPSHQARDTKLVTRRWKHYSKSQKSTQKCCRMAQTETEHQSFQETSLLSRLAVTQQIHIQRLSPENKGGFPSVPFRAGYGNRGYRLSHTQYILFYWLF
jgi:hypothetical protein